MFCMDGVRVRKTLAGRYELGEVIGRGGMGTVNATPKAIPKATDRTASIESLDRRV
jgi:hypothetical protein